MPHLHLFIMVTHESSTVTTERKSSIRSVCNVNILDLVGNLGEIFMLTLPWLYSACRLWYGPNPNLEIFLGALLVKYKVKKKSKVWAQARLWYRYQPGTWCFHNLHVVITRNVAISCRQISAYRAYITRDRWCLYCTTLCHPWRLCVGVIKKGWRKNEYRQKEVM